jgi:nicotinate dehydrogenase subunit A
MFRAGVIMATTFVLNGDPVTVEGASTALLLEVLRKGLGLTGARYGCGEEQCGACLVLVDGVAVHACGREVGSLAGRAVVTVEGVSGAIRAAFVAEQAAQCGYCASGMMVAAAGLLARVARPGRDEVVAALDGNLCRCGAHPRIVAAVLRAAEEMAS